MVQLANVPSEPGDPESWNWTSEDSCDKLSLAQLANELTLELGSLSGSI